MTTELRYCSHEQVRRLLRFPSSFTSSSNPNIEQVQRSIDQKMREIEKETYVSFRVARQREYRNLSVLYSTGDGVPVPLKRENIIIPLSLSSGDSLKVYIGSSWEEWVGTKTEGRGQDFWVDEIHGTVFVKTANPILHGIDITYRHNDGAQTTLQGDMTADNFEISGANISRFPWSGAVRIDDEEIRYSGRSSNTLTGIERDSNNTVSGAHVSGSIIFYCPEDISDACAKKVAIDLLIMNDYSIGNTSVPDSGDKQVDFKQKIVEWRNDIEKILQQYKSPRLVSL